jgi:hypothetical protein
MIRNLVGSIYGFHPDPLTNMADILNYSPLKQFGTMN